MDRAPCFLSSPRSYLTPSLPTSSQTHIKSILNTGSLWTGPRPDRGSIALGEDPANSLVRCHGYWAWSLELAADWNLFGASSHSLPQHVVGWVACDRRPLRSGADLNISVASKVNIDSSLLHTDGDYVSLLARILLGTTGHPH